LDPTKKQQIYPEFAQYEMKVKLLLESEFLHINPPADVAKRFERNLNDLFSKSILDIFTDGFVKNKKLITLRPSSKEFFASMYFQEYDAMTKDLVSGIFAKYPNSIKNIQEYWPVSITFF
jgi:hypothetical protein